MKKFLSVLSMCVLLSTGGFLEIPTNAVNEIQENTSIVNEVEVNTEDSIHLLSAEENAEKIRDQWRVINDASQITEEDLVKANKLAKPISKIIRLLISFFSLVLIVVLCGISALDIMCLLIGPLRKAIQTSVGAGSSTGGMSGNFGMGDMSGDFGMGASPMPSPQPQTNQGGITQKIVTWVSSECEDTIKECSSTPQAKLLMITYLKKRTVAVIISVVAFILLTGTGFTNIGVQIAYKITEIILGINL